MSTAVKALWSVTLDHQYIDPKELADAIVDQVLSGDLDYRSRLLIRDSMDALEGYWGSDRLQAWLDRSPIRCGIESIWHDETGDFEDGETGFPSLRRRLMEPTRPETVRSFLRELSSNVRESVRIEIGGSIALIMTGLLSRKTEDIDIVNEVPAAIRTQHQLLKDLAGRYGLEVGHFQSHYLPARWQGRIHSLGSFGKIQVYLVDAHDVFLSKLFSRRTKDFDDMRELLPKLDRSIIARRIKEDCPSILAAEPLRELGEKNWFQLTGDKLPQ